MGEDPNPSIATPNYLTWNRTERLGIEQRGSIKNTRNQGRIKDIYFFGCGQNLLASKVLNDNVEFKHEAYTLYVSNFWRF
jgi:hypothetical protein